MRPALCRTTILERSLGGECGHRERCDGRPRDIALILRIDPEEGGDDFILLTSGERGSRVRRQAPGEHPGPGLSRCEDFVGQDLDTAPPPRRVELSVPRLVKNEELHETWGVEMHYGGLETVVMNNHNGSNVLTPHMFHLRHQASVCV